MIKNLLYFVCLLFLCNSCDQEEEVVVPDPEADAFINYAFTFEFRESDNAFQLDTDVACQVVDNEITAFVPYMLKSDSLVAYFTLPVGDTVTVNNEVQLSGVTKNDFSKPVLYTIKTQNGKLKQYTVKLTTFTGLPTIHINTEDSLAIDSKAIPVKAHLKVKGNTAYIQGLYDGDIQIRGRGNSSWHIMPKKSYKITLDRKAQLLDMPADKEWVLLANYADKTLMRNYVSLELSRRLGLKYTPRSRFVEVFLNHKYMGNYLLTEQIKIAKDRVNIEELNNTDLGNEAITGGYLLEIDGRLDAKSWFKTNRGVPFCIKSPENVATGQYEYIKNFIQQTEDVLYSDAFTDGQEGYAKYINVASFVNWYLLNEITKNNDANFFTSVYLYKDRNGKLCMGPVWDYDIALGNINFNGNDHPEGFWIQQSIWINRLFQDPAFQAKVKERYNQLKASKISTLSQYINQTATYLSKSQRENFNLWNILNNYVWPNAVVLGSYEKEVAYLTDWLEKRITWLDKEFNQQL
ncbi:MAG: CotH kinase family protein [Bacteroidota bacterium]|nr:CotH kinase family protein [Bacteroidota bacterium]